MKYTKGPWRVSSMLFEETRFTGPYCQILANGTISDVQPGLAAGRNVEETEANARLIAAAPEMLELLKLCQVKIFMLDGSENPEYKAIDNLLNKIEGRKKTK